MKTRYHEFVQYTDDDWRVMQAAHDLASSILGRSSKTDAHADRLGRKVIELFNLKMLSIDQIAERAVRSERNFETTASRLSTTTLTRQTG
ncbi:hypothetical protein HB779_07070 [Phyllobacterium sp. 628]|uniref:hypothetical protein n=1 Tax=Phyllobacterium sp. 628 TaxID=2718938 RepID=UPI0016625460|nr:hypothetical protein [Phyllobacterium sp. 628]QND51686.1 hypothetical protein HB779_07070 [Phyllobacterium sp. 628]